MTMLLLHTAVGCMFFALSVARPTNIQHKQHNGEKLLLIHPESPTQASLLNHLRETGVLDVDFWSGARAGDSLPIHVKPTNEEPFTRFLQKNGIKYETAIQNLQSRVDLERQQNERAKEIQPSVVGTYPRYNELLAFMDDLVASSSIASLERIGSSFEHRALNLLKISTGANHPAIFMDARIHPREWISSGSLIWIMDYLVNQYGTDDAVTKLLDQFDFYILPIANPDGWEYTHTNDRFWRKTRQLNPGSWCYGVDGNRNFDYPVFGGPATSTNPCSDLYKGPRAFSEPETQAIRDFLLSNTNVHLYVALHSFSQLWLTPYAYSTDRPSDAQEMDRVAKIGAEALENVNGRGFTVGTPPQILYAAGGGAYDWAKGTANVKYSYTLELRPQSGGFDAFIVDPSEIEPSGREVLAGVMAVADNMQM